MSSPQATWYTTGAIDAGIKLAIDAKTMQTMMAAAGKHGMSPQEVDQMLRARMNSDARAIPEHLVPKSIPGLDTHPVEGMNPAHEAKTPLPGAAPAPMPGRTPVRGPSMPGVATPQLPLEPTVIKKRPFVVPPKPMGGV